MQMPPEMPHGLRCFAVWESLNYVGNDLAILPHLPASAVFTLCFNSHRTLALTLNLSSSVFLSTAKKKKVQGAVIYLYISCSYNPTSFSKLTFSFTIIAKNVLVDTELTRVGSSWSLLGLLFGALYWFCTECSMFSCQLKDTHLKYVTDIPFKIFFSLFSLNDFARSCFFKRPRWFEWVYSVKLS